MPVKLDMKCTVCAGEGKNCLLGMDTYHDSTISVLLPSSSERVILTANFTQSDYKNLKQD